MTKHAEFSHTILLERPVEQVFPLFTPLGEAAWVPDWEPHFIHPAGGETCDGMVFRTSHEDEETLWACVDWQPDRHRVRYARVTPTSRFALVEVACREASGGRTEARVSYAFTALNPAGEAYIGGMSQHRFAQMIEGWKDLIEIHLRAC